ncbi:hypothetical protein OS189_16755 [Sulfitobacter sp. F26169L]|uniref:hypothetical protein n=1 Tax=Sulfitobacter sp. F26169L TaxID=2996015 RepID=UPI002260D558|nr:hypothetical protein [Sulfitobacter sp. F26169L]MCX7567995.1 hypothetical protein [Sulfitobacter sp. F26169L]
MTFATGVIDLVGINGISVGGLLGYQADIDAQVGEIQWGNGNVSQILVIDVEPIGSGDQSASFVKEAVHVFALDGTAIPAFETTAAAQAFVDSITSFSGLPAGTAFPAGQNITFSTIGDAVTATTNCAVMSAMTLSLAVSAGTR